MSGWSGKRLAELCSIEIGRTPARDNPRCWDTDKQTDNVWVSIADMGKAVSASIHGSKEHLSDAGAAITPLVPEGALLLSFKLSLGKLAFAGRPLRTNEAIAALIPNDVRQINKKFLYWYFHSFDWVSAARGSEKIKGATLNKAKLKEITVPLPSLPEQKRIVAILDEAFEGIDTAVTNAKKNLASARELFESYRDSVFLGRGKRWVTSSLTDCLQLITYGFTNPMPTTDSGPYMITAKNVVGGKIDYSTARRTSAEAFENDLSDKSRPRIGDLLLTKDGTLGRVAVVDRAGICVNQSVAVLRLNGRMDALFMRHLLEASCYQKRMVSDAGGTTIKHIYITRVDKMPVSYPADADEQQSIARNLEHLAIETQGLTTVYQRKLQAFTRLKKTILQRAFAGELTTRSADAVQEAAE